LCRKRMQSTRSTCVKLVRSRDGEKF
jgi:hypothetical protein